MTDAQFIGVDLAWQERSADVVANETGVAVIDGDGQILDAGWIWGSSRRSPGRTAQPETVTL